MNRKKRMARRLLAALALATVSLSPTVAEATSVQMMLPTEAEMQAGTGQRWVAVKRWDFEPGAGWVGGSDVIYRAPSGQEVQYQAMLSGANTTAMATAYAMDEQVRREGWGIIGPESHVWGQNSGGYWRTEGLGWTGQLVIFQHNNLVGLVRASYVTNTLIEFRWSWTAQKLFTNIFAAHVVAPSRAV